MPNTQLNNLRNWVVALAKGMWGEQILRWVVIVVAALLVFTYAKGCSTDQRAADYQKQMEQWKATADAALQQNNVVKKSSDSILVAAASQEKRGDSLTSVISRLRKSQSTARQKNDSTLATLSQTLPDTCKSALNLATQYRGEADSLNRALDSATVRDSVRKDEIVSLKFDIGILRISNDSLEKVIKKVPVYTPEKILGLIPLPSRTQSFWTGYAGGILTLGAVIFLTHK